MKRNIFYLFIFFASTTFAQITVNKNNLPIPGNSFAIAVDSNAFLTDSTFQSYIDTNIADSVFWDFSNLKSAYIDSFAYLDPTLTPYNNKFPNAQMATWVEELAMYVYFVTDNSGLWSNGANIDMDKNFSFLGWGPMNFTAKNNELITGVPATYGSSFTNSAWYESEGDTFIVNEVFKQINYDGWGSIATPKDTFDVLRVYENKISVYTLYYNFFGFDVKLYELFRDTTNTYRFLADSISHPVLVVNADANNQISYIEFLTEIDPPPAADFYADSTFTIKNNLVQFYNNSSGSSEWKWYFGDGDSYIAHQPTHSYSDTGVYDVTLIASNISGSDTLIRKNYINVINSVIASFGFVDSGLTVYFSDSSYNDPTSWIWDFGDSDSSFVQNPVHNYAKPDTYTVSLTASNLASTDIISKNVTVYWGTGIEHTVHQTNVVAFPNPCNDYLKIVLSDKQTHKIELFDQIGKCLYSDNVEKSIELPVKHLKCGIYFLSITGKEKTISKIVKI